MDAKQTGLGLVQVLVFVAFQFWVGNALGPLAWLLGVIIFAVILYLIGKAAMPRRQPAQIEELWKFTMIFAVVLTAIYSVGTLIQPMMAEGMSMAQVTSIALGSWLIIFGAAMFVTGWTAKWTVTTAIGIIWAFAGLSFSFVTSNYLAFALLSGLPFIVYGLIVKE